MQYSELDVEQGLKAALDRFSKEYGLFSTSIVNSFVDQKGREVFRDVAQSWPDPWEPRFVSLAAEVIGLAIAVRKHNNEPEITNDDTRCAVATLSWFLNSFKHR